MVDDKMFLYHTLVWPPPAATHADMGQNFSDVFEGLFEDLDDAEEGSSPNQMHPHFPAMSVGGDVGSSNQPVLNVQGDMTVSGVVRAQQFLPLSDENAKCDIREADHDALSLLEQLKIHHYRFKSSPEGRQILGLLVQEVGKVVPDFVDTDDNGDRLDTNSLLSLSIQGIQQLWAQQRDIGSCLSFVLLKLSSLSKNSELTPEAAVTTPSRAQADSLQAPTTAALATAEPTTSVTTPSTAQPNSLQAPTIAALATAEPTTSVSTPSRAQPNSLQAPTIVALATAEPTTSVPTPSRTQPNSLQAPTTAALATAEPPAAGPATARPCSSTDAAEGSQAFKDNDAMVQHMLHALGEMNQGLHQMVLNRIADFGYQAVWDSFQEALPQGSQGKRLFISSLKKKQQDLKMKSAAFLWCESQQCMFS